MPAQPSNNQSALLIILPLLTGGLAGACLTAYISQGRLRLDTAIKQAEYFLSKHSEIAVVKNLLQTNKPMSNGEELNRVHMIGNWFELVATLTRSKKLDRSILEKIGLYEEMNQFRTLLNNHLSVGSEFSSSSLWWKNMYEMGKEK